ncbi:MAG: hypothetical protein V4635_02015 [Bacteroidota bacterium]
MRTFILTIILLTISLVGFGQAAKTSTFTLKRTVTIHTSTDSTRLIFKFIGPTNAPVKSHVRLTINNDTITPTIDSLGIYVTTVRLSKYKFQFFVPFWYDVCTDTINLQKDETILITVHFQPKDMRMPKILHGLGKPAIYIYPDKSTKTTLSLGLKGHMTFSYPKYENGWEFIANVDGTLEYKNKKYSYLFWEGSRNFSDIPVDFSSGFIVDSDTIIDFLENSLATSGLNQRETQDFITFWAPKMQTNKLNYVHFMFTKQYDYFATIYINPPPKNLIRVFVLWTSFDTNNKTKIRPQTFPKYSREGYTVIEWGGSELDGQFYLSKQNGY